MKISKKFKKYFLSLRQKNVVQGMFSDKKMSQGQLATKKCR